MNKILIFITIALVGAISAYSREIKEEYREILEKYDVPVEVRKLQVGDPAAFWKTLVANDMKYQKLLSDVKKETPAVREAERIISFLPRFDADSVEWLDRSAQSYCDSISRYMGLNELTPDFRLYFTTLDEPYSCSALDNDSFSVIVDKGLLETKGFNYKMLIGLVAHEYTHGLLDHRLSNECDNVKKDRRSRIANSLVAGAVGVATFTAWATMGDGKNDGRDASFAGYGIMGQKNGSQSGDITPYNYLFNRGQVLQTDLVAYRFLEKMGIGGQAYIDFLGLLANNELSPEEMEAVEHGDYPTIAYRIDFLKYVHANPGLINTENDRIRRKFSN